MPTQQETVSAVSALLDSDLVHTARLSDLLRSERAALESRDSAALQQAVDAKAAHLSTLQRNAAVRAQHLQHQGFDNSADGWQAFLQSTSADSRGPLTEKWERLAQQLKECSELIDTNGQIVARTQRTISRLLEILRGQGNAGVNMYNRRGHTQNFGDNRPITVA